MILTPQERNRQRVVEEGGRQESYLYTADTVEQLTALTEDYGMSRAAVVALLIAEAAKMIRQKRKGE